ncbi:cytidylate kinase family protein [Zhenpiania hominis]|uniref:Cytidylate kinase family protein n=1 Tax=Zhenpiania hominis TaxID=2763644 RepID=A0A923SPW5_9FIRM|nr:cytidylate kinase family protein [Zhenpiania hominis]MBC6678956.1 cytidylate kinase family protein [Zhenpiania hominis]
MSKKEVLKRYFIFLIGIYINSFGISFITKAALGTSPISSVPYVLSLGFWPTMGEFTIALSLLLILLQIALLGKKFKKASLLQIPVSIVFGYFIDWSMLLLEWVNPQEYLMKILFLLIGCVILGFGVFLEVAADVVMLPGEAFVQAVTIRFRTDFGITKVCFDASMAGSALVISLILFHGVIGVREGTIVAALTVGLIAKLFGKALKKPTAKLLPAQVREAVPEYEETGTPHRIITIGREFGSGGREVGKLVAEKLGIAYYDSEVIRRAAEESDYSEQYIRNNEEKLPDARLYDLYTQYYSYGAEEKPKYEALFQVEQKVMKELAEKNSCVIVGRASGYVFRKYKTALHVFISAGMQHKIDRVVRRDGLDPKEAEKKIKKVAIERKNHCKYFTGRDWGMAENYDLALRTDAFSVEDVADTIIKMSDKKLRAQ